MLEIVQVHVGKTEPTEITGLHHGMRILAHRLLDLEQLSPRQLLTFIDMVILNDFCL